MRKQKTLNIDNTIADILETDELGNKAHTYTCYPHLYLYVKLFSVYEKSESVNNWPVAQPAIKKSLTYYDAHMLFHLAGRCFNFSFWQRFQERQHAQQEENQLRMM